jgi:hypothetical protein
MFAVARGTIRYTKGEIGHEWRQCLICKKSFRRYKCYLTQPGWGRFCSCQCQGRAWRLFSVLLGEGWFDERLKEMEARKWQTR